ncbi:5-oxoprolinase subunit PxpB [Solimonas marina]|uniref:5-oxoprolinase subunit PxpB n=1 Tax=Solimonas marina TaxID=2714601 RepID=A0A969WEL1_9GAMM|nr:5-oxoprolinase subunit PxpB [Solimonas marina]NKF23325.1 5-oxoprolinase subunit PxpB [Solimonas marina]
MHVTASLIIDTPLPTLERLADDALLLQWSEDTTNTAPIRALCAALREAALPWLRDLVPAYDSVGVFFDPRQSTASEIGAYLQDTLRRLPAGATERDAARLIEIPVCYGGEHGPDLESAATELGLTAADLARRHADGDYEVALIGFAPGFPYLRGLDPTLALPRLATPRTRVPAGSVAIGGQQTGIYPRASPGGWRLIGSTPLRLFDVERAPPSRLLPGDRVRFVAIDAAGFADRNEHDLS